MTITKKHPNMRPSEQANASLFVLALSFFRRNVILCAAIVLSAITACIVPPDSAYLSYFDWKTLACLFCTLAVISALKNIGFFSILAYRVVQYTGNTRMAILALCYITCISSMFIIKDIAILAFLPLGYFVFFCCGKEKYLAFTFIMQTISANLGSMLTPFGNPQNLYLYTKFNISTGEFFSIMFLPFLLGMGLVTLCVLFIKKENITVLQEMGLSVLDLKRTVLYLLMFALCIAIVFRALPYWVGLAVIPAVLLFVDKKALAAVDYTLLLTFLFFFIFAGNMARIDTVNRLLSGFLRTGMDTFLCSITFSQFISNMPASILLSEFTAHYRELLLGVNIGSMGTLIASMASLITFQEYRKYNPGRSKKYLGLFSILNFSFLAVLTLFLTLFYR